MLVFLTAVFFLLITPGPGVLSTAGVGASFGRDAALRYVFGLFVGTNVVALAVVTGLAGLVFAQPGVKTVLLYASIAYLTYLALKVALAGTQIAFIKNQTPPGIRDGLALQAINPKAYVVNTTLFTGFPFEATQGVTEIALKFILINCIWIPIHLLWMMAGISLQRMDLPPATQRAISVAMGASLLIVVGLAVWRMP